MGTLPWCACNDAEAFSAACLRWSIDMLSHACLIDCGVAASSNRLLLWFNPAAIFPQISKL
jgi:hypothetical protein